MGPVPVSGGNGSSLPIVVLSIRADFCMYVSVGAYIDMVNRGPVGRVWYCGFAQSQDRGRYDSLTRTPGVQNL
jgi:hypothetical protein